MTKLGQDSAEEEAVSNFVDVFRIIGSKDLERRRRKSSFEEEEGDKDRESRTWTDALGAETWEKGRESLELESNYAVEESDNEASWTDLSDTAETAMHIG